MSETERNNVTGMKCQQCGKIVKKPIPLDALRSSIIPQKYDSVEFWEGREPRYMCAECYHAKVERLKQKPTKDKRALT